MGKVNYSVVLMLTDSGSPATIIKKKLCQQFGLTPTGHTKPALAEGGNQFLER